MLNLLLFALAALAEIGGRAAMTCRLYRDGVGMLTGVPPLAALRQALERATRQR